MATFDEITAKVETTFNECMNNNTRPWLTSFRRKIYVNTVIGQMLESLFFQLCEEFRVEQFIECGAHDAYAARLIKAKMQEANVVAYEANPFVHKNYRNLVEASGVTYLNSAVSDSDETLIFVLKEKDTKSWSSEGYIPQNQEELPLNGFRVPCTTLDAELDGRLKEISTALWVDVEGSNRRLIRGATYFFKHIKTQLLYIETQVERVWEDEFVAAELCIELKKFGLVPLVRDWPYHWGCNILFVHESLIGDTVPFLNQYLEKVAVAKISHLPPLNIMNLLRRIKRAILRYVPKILHTYVHKVAAFLGSKSSADL